MRTIIVNTDGGARGNPGPAAIGCVINLVENDSLIAIKEISEYIGTKTNNQAEYEAVIAALEWLKENPQEVSSAEFLLDSQLVVEQLNGNYKIKNEGLQPLYWHIRELIIETGLSILFKHIPREQNKKADMLVNRALDLEIKRQ